MLFQRSSSFFTTLVMLAASLATQVGAFDYEAHRSINELALTTLPEGFPNFVKQSAATARIAFLAGEPDRWRNTPDDTLKHANGPDHYFDVEDLEPLGLSVDRLPRFRYVFLMQLADARARHRASLPPIDPARNQDHTRELIGFLPWSIAEGYSKLESAFSSLQAYEEAGTPDEITNARENVLYYMGVLGHFVGDAAQPLHTTRHFNGWVGDDPKGYTTSKGFHSWIDGGYLAQVPVDLAQLKSRLRPAGLVRPGSQATADPSMFSHALAFVLSQHLLVEPLYQLEKDGKLSPELPRGRDGRAFFEKQFITAAQMLGDLWFTAWREAPEDAYLKTYLSHRNQPTAHR